ncbi:MAG: hypothetical protein HP491_10390 [Nitrospira sp.]|nr:hypothetical protein [Nitrospira sp.]MBH0186080.1 hypothetical protein [Nitrospira sp.]
MTAFRMFTFGLIGLVVTLCDFWVPRLSHASSPVTPKKEMKPSLVRPLAPDKSSPAVRWKIANKNLPQSVSDKAVVTKTKRSSRSARAPKKVGPKKLKLRAQPMAVVEPLPLIPANVAHFGMLEQPQRYDLGRDRRTGRVIVPQTMGLLHDHFPELDQNHDGVIDPFERAVGRLDIEHDATNR